MHLRSIIILLILSVFFLACEKEISLNYKEHKTFSYEECPKEVQMAIYNAYKKYPNRMDGRFSGWVDRDFTNLDSAVVYAIDKSIEGKSGVRPGVNKFEIGGKTYVYYWNGNDRNAPFILFKNSLYSRSSRNIHSLRDLKESKIDCIDLSSVNSDNLSQNDSIK